MTKVVLFRYPLLLFKLKRLCVAEFELVNRHEQDARASGGLFIC